MLRCARHDNVQHKITIVGGISLMYRGAFRFKLHTQHFFRNGWGLSILILTLSLVVSGIMIAYPHPRSAHASGGTLTITPAKGAYTNRDDQIPITAQGSLYAPNEVVNLYWNYTGPGTGILLTKATTDNNGNFSVDFLRQLAAHGTYIIAGVGQTSGSVDTGTFTILPSINLRPQAGGPGTVTTVFGYAFNAGEVVKIYWNSKGHSNNVLMATATGDSTGSFTVNVTIPMGYAPGVYYVAGVGQTSKTISSYKYTIYTPTLALAPVKGSANSTVTVSAYGFIGLETVDVYWNNGSTPIASVATSGFGYLAPTVVAVPAGTTPGSYPVKVVGRTSQLVITNTFTVLAPSSNLSASSGPTRLSVVVTGQGYTANETVHIIWNYTGPGTGNDVADLTAGYSGAFQGSFTVPAASTGAYTVAAIGATSNDFTQNTYTLNNGLAANPSNTPPGQSVTATGAGYNANETVQLYWNSTSGTPLVTTTAGANGNISQAVTIPTSATPGSNNLIGVGQTSGNTFTAPVTINTNWGNFGFDSGIHRVNPYEYGLSPGNVGNLQLKWTATTAVGLMDSPVYANGLVYIATMDGFLNAYDAAGGALKWQFNPHSTFRNYSAPAVDPAAGLVFFGTVGASDEGIPSPYYAVDAQTGALQWSVIVDWHQVSFPTFALNTLYFGTSHNYLTASSIYAIDEVSGHVRWQHSANNGFWGAIGVDPNTNTVFTGVADPNAAVLALNATTGAVVWSYPVPQYGLDDDVGSGITISNGLVYANSKNGSVYAIHENSGTLAWSTPVGPQGNGDLSTQAVANGRLYVGTAGGKVYALDALTGAILWKTHPGSSIDSSLAEANGVVYYADHNHKIIALNAATGAVLWSYTTGALSETSPIVVNGWLYCGSTDGNLYAFSL
jgi:outer membrane protein assembly factor BamB